METVARRSPAPDGARIELEGAQVALTAERELRLAAEAALRRAEELIRSLRTRLGDTELRLERALQPKPVEPPPAQVAAPPVRRRGRPRLHPLPSAAAADVAAVEHAVVPGDADQLDDESVEWWKPGWRDRFRQKEAP